ncbi:MAG TPA: HEAT repeat domain-containing protein [Isosphaeraceae bacterium]|nr:HEAT repeat domain-containing protein [Isosphaeraceae bacterium]
MPKLRVRHLIMLVAASAALLAVLQYRQGVYDPTAARLRKVRYADAAGKAAAIRELMAEEASGPAVVETLLDALRDSDPAVRALAAQAMAEAVSRSTIIKRGQDAYAEPVKAALVEALRDRDPTVRVQAASGLSVLKVKSEESFAILLRTARTPAAVPKMIGILAPYRDDRFRALGDLADCYRDKPEALTAILAAMTEHDARVRKQGTLALNFYLRGSTPVTEPIVQALLARLDDEDDSIRREAGQALSRIGRRVASRAVPLLIRNLKVPRSAFRVPTAHALRNFGIDAADARPALRALAKGNGDPDFRKAAQEALVAIEKACRTFDEETLPELIAELGNEEPSIRASAAAELAQHGARTKAAVPALIKVLDDPSPKVRRAASAALDAAGAPQAISGRALQE